MKEYWANLSDSERRTLSIGGVVLAIVLVYGLVWTPVKNNAEALRQSVQQKEAFVTWMNNAVEEAKALRKSSTSSRQSTGGQSLLAVVDQTARRSKLGPALKRVEPKGTNEVRVRLERAAFDDVVTWLTRLQRERGVGVASVSLDKEESPGRVSATLTLKGSS